MEVQRKRLERKINKAYKTNPWPESVDRAEYTLRNLNTAAVLFDAAKDIVLDGLSEGEAVGLEEAMSRAVTALGLTKREMEGVWLVTLHSWSWIPKQSQLQEKDPLWSEFSETINKVFNKHGVLLD